LEYFFIFGVDGSTYSFAPDIVTLETKAEPPATVLASPTIYSNNLLSPTETLLTDLEQLKLDYWTIDDDVRIGIVVKDADGIQTTSKVYAKDNKVYV
jgi:hypothetical protein